MMPEKDKAQAGGPPSPIIRARHVPELTRLLLFVRACGRCEFDDCNRYLMEHHVTLTEGIFAEMAHIVAFKPDGPRGAIEGRPIDVHAIDNLMLLCPGCHTLIDRHPGRYTRATLEGFKKAHEQHMSRVTGLQPGKRTAVLVVTATVGQQTVSIPPAHVFEAVQPLYPISKAGTTVDLTAMGDEGDAAIAAACEAIRRKVQWLVESSDSELASTGHLSVFALGPMPVLMFLGSQLSNKIPTDTYQRHRDTETWTWKTDGRPVRYLFREVRSGPDRDRVALVLSLSGVIGPDRLPGEIDERFSVYEMTLEGLTPTTGFLRQRADLDRFRDAYQAALGALTERHGVLRELHVFPAVPAPVAVLCGRERLPKAHPALLVYDFDKNHHGFAFKLRVE